MTYKNIRVKKRGGGTRLQRVKVLKSGKYKFVKNKGTRRSRSSRRKSNPSRRKRRVARRRKRRRRSRTIPLGPVLGLAAGMVGPAQALMEGNIESAAELACRQYTGYSFQHQHFDANELKKGLVPLVAGLLVHKFVGGWPLNLNRTLAAAGVPYIRI